MPTLTAVKRVRRFRGASGSFRRVRCDVTTLPVVEKDILSVGHKHLAGGEVWHVTPKTLHKICENFKRFRAAGNRVPLIYDHEGGARERAGDVIGLRIDGNKLVARCQITDHKSLSSFGARPGDTTTQEVSVEVSGTANDPWIDGDGNKYVDVLTHLAIVLNPVETHQGPFKRVLSLRKVRRMADEEKKSEGDGEGQESETMMAVSDVVAMLQEGGYGIPDDVSTVKELKVSWKTLMGGSVVEESQESPPSTPTESSLEASSPVYMSLKGNHKKLEAEVTALRRQLSIVDQQKKDAEKKAYHDAVDELATENRITPAEAKQYKDGADAAKSYQLSLLAPLKKLPQTAVHLGGTAKRLGAGTVEGGKDPGPMTPERAKEIIKARRAQSRF